MAATSNGHVDVVNVLIEARADINQRAKVMDAFLFSCVFSLFVHCSSFTFTPFLHVMYTL